MLLIESTEIPLYLIKLGTGITKLVGANCVKSLKVALI